MLLPQLGLKVLYKASISEMDLIKGNFNFRHGVVVAAAERDNMASLDEMWLHEVTELYALRLLGLGLSVIFLV